MQEQDDAQLQQERLEHLRSCAAYVMLLQLEAKINLSWDNGLLLSRRSTPIGYAMVKRDGRYGYPQPMVDDMASP